MTPDEMAALHRACFPDRPWQAGEIAELLDRPATLCLHRPGGFLIASLVPPEAEILTLAVDPVRRRHGVGGALVGDLISRLGGQPDARLFLEVAQSNAAARALYASCGFRETGRRRGYYVDGYAPAGDALLMEWSLTQGQEAVPAGKTPRIG